MVATAAKAVEVRGAEEMAAAVRAVVVKVRGGAWRVPLRSRSGARSGHPGGGLACALVLLRVFAVRRN